tara:strand:- start:323 stop:565 length:243 start_codon:yes stop_codon:yes gene_type:complete
VEEVELTIRELLVVAVDQVVDLDQQVVLWVLEQQIKDLQVVLERERQAQMLTLVEAEVAQEQLVQTESTVVLAVVLAVTE